MIDKNNLPQGWAIAKLGEVCTYSKGKMPQILKREKDNECSIPYINIKAFEKGIFADFTNGVKCNLCDDDDLLMVWDGARCGLIGKAKKGAVGSTLMKILPAKYIHKEYLFHFIKSKFSNLNSKPKGVGIPHIEPTLLWNFELPIAPLPEQHRIVKKIEELFTDLDKGIEYLETAQQQLKVYRQSVLKWAFEGKLTNEKNIKWGKLKEVCEGVEYGSAAKSKKQGKIPVLRMGNIQNGKLDWSDLVYTSDEAEIKKYFLQKDDVLFNRTNSPEWVGKTAIYKGEQPAIFAGYLIRINRNKKMLDAKFLNHFLNSHTAKRHGNKVKSFGVNQSNINGTKLKAYPFPIITLEAQKKIVIEIESRLSVCDKIEEAIEDSLLKAEALRLSIIKKGFEGKLTKQNPKDESAEILLTKIRAEIKKNNPDKPKKEVKIKTSKKKKELA